MTWLFHQLFSITQEDKAIEINEVFDANMIDGSDVLLQNV